MANVKLSKDELELVTNAELILTKNRIIQKVYELFGELSIAYRELSKDLDEDLLHIPPKISKGENYLGLPWVMLDYPRNFHVMMYLLSEVFSGGESILVLRFNCRENTSNSLHHLFSSILVKAGGSVLVQMPGSIILKRITIVYLMRQITYQRFHTSNWQKKSHCMSGIMFLISLPAILLS